MSKTSGNRRGATGVSVDSVVDDLLYVLPVIHKKLLRLHIPAGEARISRLHFIAMTMIDDEGRLPVCEIARRLGVKKSQMTAVINQLVAQGMAMKQRDSRDRRVTNVVLTDGGRAAINEFREIVREGMKSRLSFLNSEELEGLAMALRKLKQVGERLRTENEKVSPAIGVSKQKRRSSQNE